ncbi:hypothetical protein L1987_18673 [Smallanthus sonchifolius]|uniref:Uncharacterized protein n=1 Tax=Smallanthus sonchifolius TaxID=185202 RepID=A0ACB9J0E8_9ASTR|nr:hypothetical protein L1987_18673 [Smallanthus sonchifolius]
MSSFLQNFPNDPSTKEKYGPVLPWPSQISADFLDSNQRLSGKRWFRFDDRETGKLEAVASRAKIVHIDIDSAEFGKNKQPHVLGCGDIKIAQECDYEHRGQETSDVGCPVLQVQ